MVFAKDLLSRIMLQLAVTIALMQLVTASGLISWDSGCGTTKGCFPKCTSGCQYLATWTTSGSSTTFELKAEEWDTDVYLAIGFSKDRYMGDDSVVGCIVPGTTVYSYFNERARSDRLSTPSLGLSSTSVSQTNGVISCSFTRSLTAADDKYFDLNNDYVLMLVIGETEEEGDSYKLEDHRLIPWMSDDNVDFNSNKTYDLYKLNGPAVKLHGIMMVLAWLFLVIVGIVTARYNKDMLPGETLFGTKVWLQIHRGAMVAAVVCVVIGIIPIFVELEGYSRQVLPEYAESHPIFGIIVTVLCLINLLMGLVRPGNDHKFLRIFNWAHLAVGVVSQVLAIVAIFLGYVLKRSMLSNKAIYVTVTHLIVIGLGCGALEIHRWFGIRRKNQFVEKEITVPDDLEMKEIVEPPKPSNIPLYLLLLLGGFSFASTLALLVIIADS